MYVGIFSNDNTVHRKSPSFVRYGKQHYISNNNNNINDTEYGIRNKTKDW